MTRGPLIELTGDLFDITGRLKAIDEGYSVCYHTLLHRFEVHNRRQRGGSLAVVVPYPELDARTVTLVRRTRAERADRLAEELEDENRRARASALAQAAKNAEDRAERAFGRL